ncbi:pseudouridine synthase, partial [Trichodelitschia bisporula]
TPAMASTTPQPDYSTWSAEQLIQRVTELEKKLKEQNAHFSPPAPTAPSPTAPAPNAPPTDPQTSSANPLPPNKPKPRKRYNPSKYSTRLIALKFAYLGRPYNGYEYHANNPTPLPTIEEELWKALVKTRLIFPDSVARSGLLEGGRDAADRFDAAVREGRVQLDWEGCEYSKCGRTDRGVSAFGQVVGIRVRSARPVGREAVPPVEDAEEVDPELPVGIAEEDPPFDPVADEIPYIALLNKNLPPSIRVLAWCPDLPPNFSARFNCKERRYRYFFTAPAFLPIPGQAGLVSDPSSMGGGRRRDGWLDIEAMREAAAYLVGSHDFRNFCKVDPSKQIESFVRRISAAGIEFVSEDSRPAFVTDAALAPVLGQAKGHKLQLFAFSVKGSAFLWHQVRCMVAVLFLVGQGLERPDVVRRLLDVEAMPCRPKYEMASDAPLVLWECAFSASESKRNDADAPPGHWDRGQGEDELVWVEAGQEAAKGSLGLSGKWARNGIVEDLWRGWRGAKMDEVLAGQLLDLVGRKVFDGDAGAKSKGRYVPIMEKERMEAVGVINARWAAK